MFGSRTEPIFQVSISSEEILLLASYERLNPFLLFVESERKTTTATLPLTSLWIGDVIEPQYLSPTWLSSMS